MEEEVVVDEIHAEKALKPAHSKDGFVLPENDKHEMFEGKNIHSSPVDGKPLCSFSQKMCMQRRLNGFAFCIRHILEDKQAPFKQCQFVTKYNGNKCINPVPLAEERIYCNSHLQVLGLAPKKTKKKPMSLEALFEEKSASGNESTGPADKKIVENCTKTKPKPQANRNLQGKGFMVERSYFFGNHSSWNMCKPAWNHFRKRQGGGEKKFTGNVKFKAVEELRKVTQGCACEPLFKNYMTNLNEHIDNIGGSVHQAAFEELGVAAFSAQQMSSFENVLSREKKQQLLQLSHQHAQLKLSIREQLNRRELSYSVLSKLISAARENPAATANVLLKGNQSKSFRVRKIRASDIRCSCKVGDNVCSRPTLPFSMYCSKHIGRDSSQVLFGKCTAKFPIGTSCALPVVDFVNERPLCQEHARKRAESIEKCTTKTPPKKVKRPVTEEEKEKEKIVKSPPKNKNLKCKLQRKFAIPVKPTKKSTTVPKRISEPSGFDKTPVSSSVDPGLESRLCNVDKRTEARNRRRVKLREIAQREALSKMNANAHVKDIEESEVHTQKIDGGVPTISPFDIQDDSLSSPSLSPTYEIDEMSSDYSRGSLLGIDCNHTDSFDPEDEEMNLQLSKHSMLTKPSRQVTRQLTSPTLNQLSIDSFGRKGSLGSLCSPKRLHFSNTSTLSPPQNRRLSPSHKLDGNDLPFSASITPVGRNTDGLGADSRISTPSSIASNGEDDRYVLDGLESEARLSQSRLRVISPPREFNFGKSSVSKVSWSTKFTLPTRNDVPLATGFIRMSPSSSSSPSNASIYSPPFGGTGSPRSKAQIFKFDSSSGFHQSTDGDTTSRTVDFSSSKDSVFVPIQDRLVIMDKRAEKEPPIEKVNPDIFFSPAAFSSTPSSAS